MPAIYIYTSPTGLSYVGKTNNPERRWREHCSSAHNFYDKGHNTPFHRAIRQHGEENMKRTLLMITSEDVGVIEKNMIKSLNTQFPNGYNITSGGEGFEGDNHPSWNHALTDDMIKEDHANGLSTHKSASKRNCSQSTIERRRNRLGLKSEGIGGGDSPFTHAAVDEMERLNKVERWTLMKIGEKFNCSATTVSSLIRGKSGPRRWTPSEN